MNEIENDEYLIHYGVLGMKWGIRRKFERDSGISKLFKRKKNKPDTDEDKEEEPKKKSVKDMSDDELTSAIRRLENEKRYTMLTTPEVQEKESKGKKIVEDILEKSAKNIGTQTTTYIMGAGVNAIGKKFGIPQIVNPKKGQKDKSR